MEKGVYGAYAYSQGPDQTVHSWNLIRAFSVYTIAGCCMLIYIMSPDVSCSDMLRRHLFDDMAQLTHCILNRLYHTIYWKSPISILGTSGYEIYIFLEKNG